MNEAERKKEIRRLHKELKAGGHPVGGAEKIEVLLVVLGCEKTLMKRVERKRK